MDFAGLSDNECWYFGAKSLFLFVICKAFEASFVTVCANSSHRSNYGLRRTKVPKAKTRSRLHIGVDLVQRNPIDFITSTPKSDHFQRLNHFDGFLHLLVHVGQGAGHLHCVVV